MVGSVVRTRLGASAVARTTATPRQRRPHHTSSRWPVLAVISAGGALGALARFGLAQAFRPMPGRFPTATFATNALGCLLIGVLMVLVVEVWSERRLVRPFLGVGVLGGFTTFSSYVVDIQRLTQANTPGIALVYLVGTPLAALVAVMVGVAGTRWALSLFGEEK